MFSFFDSPGRALKLSRQLLKAAVAMLVTGLLIAYGLDTYVSLIGLVLTQLPTFLRPTAISLELAPRGSRPAKGRSFGLTRTMQFQPCRAALPGRAEREPRIALRISIGVPAISFGDEKRRG
ncbi:hypothetical protein [Metapseudomonas resinovorans]|uniref:Uncharacterized protein n=1 Tax=Metapseudomonas resinovorans NBRC 106553 TaxID=1245471 RepID=S6AS35_METRE|nr:hypothetical protein [Pseudomonas resinovorans]BAN48808.1 hypothetical protein PCA10_30760 [Pseudomonas resinovorans NBRC 106553]